MKEDFELRVKRQVEQLRKQDYRSIEAAVTKKRLSWFRQHCQVAGKQSLPSPREAYELLFFDYMGLSKEEVPVVLETDTEIEWLSQNRCPTLEACKRLGLDTRDVCRAAYEKSTQALLSRLDPQLRFYRSYEEMRPHANHCREMIIRVDFADMMRIAIQEAKTSKKEGNKGYGAVVAFGNQILGKAHDTAISEKDPGLHAEVNAIRQAVRTLGDANLSGAVLFSTCEPCPMCSALAVWANITTIVYGVSIEETARLGKSRIHVGAGEIAERSPVMIEVVGNVIEEECRALYL